MAFELPLLFITKANTIVKIFIYKRLLKGKYSKSYYVVLGFIKYEKV